MARKCTICYHKDRELINLMIASGTSNRSVLVQFPDLSLGAIQRHKAHIVPKISPREITSMVLEPAVRTMPTRTTGVDIPKILSQIETLVDESQKLVDTFNLSDEDGKFIGTANDVKAKSAAINSLKSTLEFITKLFGLLSPDGISPGYLKLQEDHEHMKKFVMERLCDECRAKLIRDLEE